MPTIALRVTPHGKLDSDEIDLDAPADMVVIAVTDDGEQELTRYVFADGHQATEFLADVVSGKCNLSDEAGSVKS